ncbi:hypothetical protein TNCT_729531 [Trichonephila clavata]|uniref:Uncharacterized protein n=1 Tax=Trichonephila clavata TaxID=2740835 RepID=A0A8X6LVX7_TRICU|nr:hypothetical protein TNCT_729531 [Trichonephila clavata]
MTSISELGTPVDDQSVQMEDISVLTPLTDEQKCTKLKGFEKEVQIFSARKDYVAQMLPIEKISDSPNKVTMEQLESELQNLERKLNFLEGKVTGFLPCPVALCKHNYKFKTNKRHADPILRPAKLTNLTTENNNNSNSNEFTLPKRRPSPFQRRIAKIPFKPTIALQSSTLQKMTPVANKTKSINMKMNDRYSQILQELHSTILLQLTATLMDTLRSMLRPQITIVK